MNTDERGEAHILGVLEAIGERENVSQRRLAQRLGVALGLTNAYLKRCVRKGLVKVQQVPGNRYLYYLTPKGFAEKSRLSASYLSHSLAFYRKAGNSCLGAFDECRDRGWENVVLGGISDLAEIAFVRSQERDVQVLGFVDASADRRRFLGRPVLRDAGGIDGVDGCMVTDLQAPAETYDHLCAQLGEARVLVPDILEWRPRKGGGSDHS